MMLIFPAVLKIVDDVPRRGDPRKHEKSNDRLLPGFPTEHAAGKEDGQKDDEILIPLSCSQQVGVCFYAQYFFIHYSLPLDNWYNLLVQLLIVLSNRSRFSRSICWINCSFCCGQEESSGEQMRSQSVRKSSPASSLCWA